MSMHEYLNEYHAGILEQYESTHTHLTIEQWVMVNHPGVYNAWEIYNS